MVTRREQMTSRQRMEALLNRQPVDRVAFDHRGRGFSARNVGYEVADIYEHPAKSFQAQLWTAEQYGSDGTPVYSFVSYGAWEFGGEIRYPRDRHESGPSVVRRPVDKPEDLWKLEMPDVRTAGCIPRQMEFAKLQDEHGVPITFICGSPFTFAANLCGVEKFMLWIVDCPEAVHKAMRLMTDHLLEVAKYFVDTFGKNRLIARTAAPTESNGLISPRQFRDFALPYIKELHGRVLEMGVRTIHCHICGDHNANLPYWAEVPMGDPGVVNIAPEIDILTAAKHFPNDIISGNIRPQLIAMGPPEQIYAACREAIGKGKMCRNGYILTAGCETPASTPPYHMYVMKKACDEFGWYG